MGATTRTISAKPNKGWPVFFTAPNAVGVSHLEPAGGSEVCYYLTSLHVTNLLDADGFYILRQNAIQLTAADNTVTISDNAALEPAAGDASWSMWVKTSDVSLASLFSKDDASDDGYILEVTAAGLAKFTIGDGSDVVTVTSTRRIDDGQWHHIVVTADRDVALGLLLYVDGDLSGTTAGDLTDVDGVTAGATDFIIAGTNSKTVDVSGFGFYKGLALTTTDIAALYVNGVGKKFIGTETSLSAAINMDEGVGTACYDMVAANNGTLANGAFVAGGAPRKQFDDDDLGVSCQILGKTATPIFEFNFNPALKIGRNSPLALLHTDGSFTLIACGYVDRH